MCLGHTHAISGGVSGAAVSLYVLHLPPLQTVMLTGFTAGAAVLPDIDHPEATLAQSFGFLTKAFAWLVGQVSGGHRHGTHSIVGVAVFTALAWAAVAYRATPAGRAGLAVLLSLIFAGGLYALRIGGHKADIAAVGLAAWMAWSGHGLALVALATGLGAATHIAGDMLTDSGCPLLWPASTYRFKFWPEPLAFTTGTRPEAAVAMALLGVLAFLGWHAAALALASVQ